MATAQRMKSSGLRTLPCGMPQSILDQMDWSAAKFTISITATAGSDYASDYIDTKYA